MMFNLDNRLALCAGFVRENSSLADIGTDHAYLPVWLALNHKIKSAVACDIRPLPLKNAQNNIDLYGVGDIVSTVLSDGLDEISPECADDIVIAGMGGELISKIISRTLWLRDENKRLILQPMTRADSLRLFLCQNGFKIINEKPCISLGKSYSVMSVAFDGIIRQCDDIFKYTGLLQFDDSIESKKYISVINGKLKKKLNAFEKDSDEFKNLLELTKKLDSLSKEDEP